MFVIHKRKFPLREIIELPIPLGSKILSIQKQNGEWCVWYLFDTEEKPGKVHLRTIGTGHPIDARDIKNLEFLATVQDGDFVWHFFRIL